MGLLDKLNEIFNSRKNANLLIVGLDNSGKTSIVNNLKPGNAKSTTTSTATVGFNVEKFVTKNISVTAFDMSGQSRYRNLWEHYYRETDAIIYVVDSSDRMRLVVSREELASMLTHPDLRNRPQVPVLVFANKSDLKEAASAGEIRGELEIDRIERNRACRVFACSALKGNGIGEGIDWLAQEIYKIKN